jgi:hypothetical protein
VGVVLFCEARDARKISHVHNTCHRNINKKTTTKTKSQALARETYVTQKFKFGILGEVFMLCPELSVG